MSNLIDFDGNFDSGLCIYLTKKPDKYIEYTYEGAVIKADPAHQLIFCEFNGASNRDETHSKGYKIIQEVLDILCLNAVTTLITEKSDEEYLSWWNDEGKRKLYHHITISQPMKIGPIQITSYDKDGNVVPPVKVKQKYHHAFRYFRLSQASDDIYDAYRNMYLALELLVSSELPFDKKKYTERNWLKAFLFEHYKRLQLTYWVGEQEEKGAGILADEIYRLGRLPLFHAKEGRDVYIPADNFAEKIQISKTLEKLSFIIKRITDSRFNVGRSGASISHSLMNKVSYDLLHEKVLVITDEKFDKNIGKVSSFIAESKIEVESLDDDEMEVVLHAECSLESVKSIETFHVLSDEGEALISWSFDIGFDVSTFDNIEICGVCRQFLLNNPKRFYSR
ncbi:hypothetical protein [Thalassotalea montiporae]